MPSQIHRLSFYHLANGFSGLKRLCRLFSNRRKMRGHVISKWGSRRTKNINVGGDAIFHHVKLGWIGNTLRMTRRTDFVVEVPGVRRVALEYRWVSASEQDILFLRLFLENGKARAFFLDNDPVQTNVREVSAELERLEDVFRWLLPTEYIHRHGDVGIYRRESVPVTSHLIPVQSYPESFVPILSKRHALEPAISCEFYTGDGRYHLKVIQPARMVHPEHPAISLSPGIYELLAARGAPLPEFVGLRDGESAQLERVKGLTS